MRLLCCGAKTRVCITYVRCWRMKGQRSDLQINPDTETSIETKRSAPWGEGVFRCSAHRHWTTTPAMQNAAHLETSFDEPTQNATVGPCAPRLRLLTLAPCKGSRLPTSHIQQPWRLPPASKHERVSERNGTKSRINCVRAGAITAGIRSSQILYL